MYSHHSHSGDYVAHGVDPLEDIITEVKRRKFHTWCMTEHMPRLELELLYPEEKTNESSTEEDLKILVKKFEAYMIHAKRIKDRETASENGLHILIGFEIEGCDLEHMRYANELLRRNNNVLQFMVGSVHHVHNIPIDFNQEKWNEALKVSGNNLRQLLYDYFTIQRKMLETTQPLVVGHFDLIRLFLPDDMRVDLESGQVLSEGGTLVKDLESVMTQWSDVKQLIVESLKYVVSYGGVVEINSAGLRKGKVDPYPHRDIVNLSKEVTPSIRYVTSDDAHGVSQIAVCYDEMLNYIENVVQLKQISYLEEQDDGNIQIKDIFVEEVKRSEFWSIK
ncbi:histidinol-phosphatase [Kluyveromyces lactis]|uniref:Histidinol-phosphatase n=1 Tax=Kluyveromyces lactis (strain ATCC 8585 / CBS 2359 / DSM 70799 / NBRC 1267 / NRRL Y-1140 / WM37) TaxID=284590 RepID=Q6CXG5_KLULA|nr:uncharacterized protein KLLA0_A08470g [Kluyveromyces lactis]CAH02962.1 KLLA0A08470p [Kluyveromyces lactis]|eukprot:XP_451374.1 uncharacterized protein KLLA0_A08470g [Kluyveromyces lactis]